MSAIWSDSGTDAGAVGLDSRQLLRDIRATQFQHARDAHKSSSRSASAWPKESKVVYVWSLRDRCLAYIHFCFSALCLIISFPSVGTETAWGLGFHRWTTDVVFLIHESRNSCFFFFLIQLESWTKHCPSCKLNSVFLLRLLWHPRQNRLHMWAGDWHVFRLVFYLYGYNAEVIVPP